VQSSETDTEIRGSLSIVDSSSRLDVGSEAEATICATMGKISPSLVRFEPYWEKTVFGSVVRGRSLSVHGEDEVRGTDLRPAPIPFPWFLAARFFCGAVICGLIRL
jgi:hypothetical protein